MSDTIDTTTNIPAPAAAAPISPVVETSAAAPVAATSSTDTPPAPAAIVSDAAPIPVVAAEPAKVEAKTEGKPETPAPPVENILGDDKAKETPKTDAKPETKPEVKADTTKVELPVYEEFKLPDGMSENVKIDKPVMDSFTQILGEIETGKFDHAGMQSAGQKLIDLAAKNTVESINRLNDYYVNFHENQKKEWFESAKKDAELGNGDENKFREIAGQLRTSIDEYAGNDAQRSEFRSLMKETGVGNHPALLRMLNNMQKKIDSYTKEKSGMSVPAQAPAPSKVKPYQMFYNGNG